MSRSHPKPPTLRIADLFCGAGGTSTGALAAAEAAGFHVELTAGMSFPRDYRFTGTKTDAVKQIGNAVPPQLAAALQSVHLPKNKAA